MNNESVFIFFTIVDLTPCVKLFFYIFDIERGLLIIKQNIDRQTEQMGKIFPIKGTKRSIRLKRRFLLFFLSK
jgi:hypothetical protein